MKMLLITAFLLSSMSTQAAITSCEGWYQEAGGAIEKTPLTVTKSDAANVIHEGASHGYSFKADWNIGLTTYYISISTGPNRILVTTARVPTANHPENFTDLNIPGGPRLSVNCEMK